MASVLVVNNRYPVPERPHQATFIKSINEAIEDAGFRTRLLVNTLNATSGIKKGLDSLHFAFKVRTSNYWEQTDLYYLNHFTQYYLFIPKKYRRRPHRTVIHWHGSDLFPQTPFSRWLSHRSWERIPKETTHIVPSSDFGERLQKELTIQNLYISPSGGVDTEHFAPAPKKEHKNALVLGFASRLTVEKGAPFLLKILEEMERIRETAGKPVIIKYIDQGDEASAYSPKLKASGYGVDFAPFPKERMPEFYQDVDVMLFPTRRESLGLAALEAMSCGVPLVGTDDFALREYLISGKTGESFPLDDHETGIEALIRCISQKGIYDPRAFVLEHYSRERVIEFYRELFEHLLAKGE